MDDFAQGRSWSLGLPHNIDNPVAHQTTVANANVLTSNAPPYDPAMGTYQLRALLCRIEPTTPRA